MHLRRTNALIYGILAIVWLLVVAWQTEEHVRIREAAKADLRNRSREIASTLSAVIRALRFRGAVVQDRLEPVLNLLVTGRTNELVRSSELISVALLNAEGDPLVFAGDTNYLAAPYLAAEGEHWGKNVVTFVNPVYGVSLNEGANTNAITVLPSFRSLTNEMHEGREFPGPGPAPEHLELRGSNGPPSNGVWGVRKPGASSAEEMVPPPPPPTPEDTNNPERRRMVFFEHERERFPGGPPHGPRRPPWMRWMSEGEFKALVAKRELHGLVLAMSTDNYRAVCIHDLWLRLVIVFFAGISAAGFGLAWRNMSRTADLQIRLVRASELNSHLKEMNLAAAGLAHETRNPLNLIRGQAQMLAKRPDVPPAIREKARVIVDEADKITAQLTEFINYSRPREVRRAKVILHHAVAEVIRALSHDIEEKKMHVETQADTIAIEADEQLLRQVLFNLLMNAIQAAGENGRIQILARRESSSEAVLEVRDDGPGVPPENRAEIFKPYFTTHRTGTGLGLAIVQQIVLAHGWEIECLANEPRGAVFRIRHLKLAA